MTRDRQYNGHKKKDQKKNNSRHDATQKTKDWGLVIWSQHDTTQKTKDWGLVIWSQLKNQGDFRLMGSKPLILIT